MEVTDRIYSLKYVLLNNEKSMTRIVQRKIGKVPYNTGSTTKLSFINDLGVSVIRHRQTTDNLTNYVPDRQTKNRIEKIKQVTFSELGFKERGHLQEWLEANPEALGEDFLIIQKEFSGFNDTNERLDLLALDKKGNAVIIENKLDDTGRDVTWQALKYASYCSTLTKEQIRNIFQQYLDKRGQSEEATNKLSEFFNNAEYEELTINISQSQRIILVAGSFRKEVTSTVLWLLNFKIKMQCFKALPFALGEQLFLTVEQIIPTKDAEDYTISMVDKAQEDLSTQEELKERHHLRLEFWSKLLPKIKGKATIFQNSSPSKDHWLSSGGTGISGLSYNFLVTKSYVGVELAITKSDTQANKQVFDELKKFEPEITNDFGDTLSWERLDNKKMCRVAFSLQGVNLNHKDEWDKMMEFLTDNMVKLEKSMREPLKKVKRRLNEKEETE